MNQGRATCRGFTLIEVLVSTAIATILFGAIGSCIMIASKAYPSQNSPLARAVEAAQAAEFMSADLRYAKTVVSGSAKSLVFTVADRTGDNVDEVIGYMWSGTAGDPLQRLFNSAATENVVDSVQSLKLQYDIRSVTGTTTRKYLDRVLIELDAGLKGTSRAMRQGVLVISTPEVQ
ncbi:MAG: prepilin-type N-terminal cleavage/methylation domain-containing protein [Planctomycetes bacterium]|nr:prepilin-type N-terminal cleavage/methylation domain-containing protein [Planctomycetota bacterium]